MRPSLVTVYCREREWTTGASWDVMIGDVVFDSCTYAEDAVKAAQELDAAIEQALAEREPPQMIVEFPDRFQPVGRKSP